MTSAEHVAGILRRLWLERASFMPDRFVSDSLYAYRFSFATVHLLNRSGLLPEDLVGTDGPDAIAALLSADAVMIEARLRSPRGDFVRSVDSLKATWRDVLNYLDRLNSRKPAK